MPITAFTVGTSRTINLGNFESLRIEASVTYDISEGELEGCKEIAQTELRKLLEDTFRAQHVMPTERKKLTK